MPRAANGRVLSVSLRRYDARGLRFMRRLMAAWRQRDSANRIHNAD